MYLRYEFDIIELKLFKYLRIMRFHLVSVSTKKEKIENLQKKLGEVLGLERAAQKAVDELIIIIWQLKSGSKNEAKEN